MQPWTELGCLMLLGCSSTAQQPCLRLEPWHGSDQSGPLSRFLRRIKLAKIMALVPVDRAPTPVRVTFKQRKELQAALRNDGSGLRDEQKLVRRRTLMNLPRP